MLREASKYSMKFGECARTIEEPVYLSVKVQNAANAKQNLRKSTFVSF